MWTAEQYSLLSRTLRTHPDPRVRHRVQALLFLADGHSISETARLLHTARHRVRAWKNKFLAAGISGLTDLKRSGRPPKLDKEDISLLEESLKRSPTEYSFLSTTWTVRDLAKLIGFKGTQICSSTVHKYILKLGYRYRRPRHDLTHRQDVKAVASAKEVLEWLKKSAPQVVEGFNSSSLMNVRFTLIPSWQKSGKREVSL